MLLFEGDILVAAFPVTPIDKRLCQSTGCPLIKSVANEETIALGELVIYLDDEVILIFGLRINKDELGTSVSEVSAIGKRVQIEIRPDAWIHSHIAKILSLLKGVAANKPATAAHIRNQPIVSIRIGESGTIGGAQALSQSLIAAKKECLIPLDGSAQGESELVPLTVRRIASRERIVRIAVKKIAGIQSAVAMK